MWAMLTETMENLVVHYRALKAIGQEKEKRLIAADVPVIEQLTKEEEKLIAAISEQENARQRSLAAILPVCGEDKKDATLAEVAAYAEEPYRTRLLAANEALGIIVKELKAVSDRNARLIKQALSIVEYNINLLTQPVDTPAYTAGGHAPGDEKAPRSLFDHKA